METQYISLNMTPTGVNPCFHISQYDVGRMLGFIVHSGGATVDLDTYTCTIEATRSDGTAITSAVATTDNIGTFEVTPTMSNKADKYRCQLIIVDENSKRIASLPFDMDVTKAAMDENSEAIEEDASLYQQYTEAVQGAIAEANADIQAEENARIAAVSAEATARQNADATLQNKIDAEATARQTADNTLQGNINSEASTRASADSNLQSQINQIVAPSGEAPSAAEVQNARIGADGVTYSTLGEAIRGQVNDLKGHISGNTVMYNTDNVLNSVIWTDGFYPRYNNGTIATNANYSMTNLISVFPGSTFICSNVSHTAFYKADGTYVSGSTDQIFTVPATAAFMRTSCQTANKSSVTISIVDDVFHELKSNIFNGRFNSKVVIDGWLPGKYVYFADGHIGNSSSYSCSERIALNANAEYKISGVSTFQYAIYDASGTYIRGSMDATSFIPTDNEFYFRFSCPTADLSNLSITYSFKSLIMNEASELFKQPTITWTDGKYRRYNDGSISTNANWSYSSFIPVIPNEAITCGYDINHISFFDENFAYVTGWLNKNAMKVPNGALYMCVSLPTANKSLINITHNAEHITLTEANYSYYKNAFDEAQALLLPIHVIGGEYDVSDIYQTIGLQLYNDLIGIGNPRFYASPSTYNNEFSIINLKASTKNKNITVDGITFDATNMRYCVHDEMGGTTTLEGIHGYKHIYKNCTFISRENVYRPVGIGFGDDGLITFENCIFESTAENAPVNLLDIHSGFQGQNKHTNSFVKDCIFINGTCSFTEVGSNDYSSDKNICVAENNYCSAEPYVTRTNNKQIQFYSWNNHIVQ